MRALKILGSSGTIHLTLNVGDDQMVDIESLVVGIGFGVLQERKQEFGGLLGPTTLSARGVPSLGLSVTTGTAHVTPIASDE